MSKEASRLKTREHILQVAREQFYRKGYSGVSINEIVDELEVTKPTVYYHFGSKAGLFAALVQDAYDRYYEHRRQAVDSAAPAAEQIYQVIAADFACCLAETDLVRFVVALTFALPEDRPEDFSKYLTRDYEFFRSIIERGIERGELCCKDAGEAAIALQGIIAVNILSFLQMGQGKEFLSPERARILADILLNGIKA
ncbi:MAG: TetR/AcrR family transcriptional regulator [Acidobacteriota bacterium]|nr:TetR/AcrR family transcriptional regulator [Blastocatellia bacterium]MDW8411662.1 TetR/AcrR family transcriptional regulator [Acidobacteriota bacterium]